MIPKYGDVRAFVSDSLRMMLRKTKFNSSGLAHGALAHFSGLEFESTRSNITNHLRRLVATKKLLLHTKGKGGCKGQGHIYQKP